jgi:hypothetical protein
VFHGQFEVEGVIMQKTILESAIQPYLKLVHRNMELMKHLSVSPEIKPLTSGDAENPFRHAQACLAQLTQSSAVAMVMQGAFKNYTEFLLEISQTNMFAASQTQESLARVQDTLVRQGQAVVEAVAAEPVTVLVSTPAPEKRKDKEQVELQGA